MTPRNESEPQREGEQRSPEQQQQGGQQGRRDAPRYDDRPEPDAAKKSASNDPKEAGTQRSSETSEPAPVRPTKPPRYGDQESDDPRRSSVEAKRAGQGDVNDANAGSSSPE